MSLRRTRPVTSREVLALFKDLHENDGVSFLLVTHSKEVAAFANRSLELRDGRFVAEHGESVDVENLAKDRELIIDETGTAPYLQICLSDLVAPVYSWKYQQRIYFSSRRICRIDGQDGLGSHMSSMQV